ncbi:MAG: hypothetical protein KF901_08895 [Myxococcales bacterium]|nr:hypothetical protein [Myxococcales bacterium]
MTQRHAVGTQAMKRTNPRKARDATSGSSEETKRPRRARAAPVAPQPTPGRPRRAVSEWESWVDVAEAFARETSAKPVDVQVLAIVLSGARSWADFLGGSWLRLASTRIYTSGVRGFGPARTHRLIERFVVWLHRAGEICTWQRDVLLAALDTARRSSFQHVENPRCCPETCLSEWAMQTAVRDFAGTLGHPVRQAGAEGVLRVLRAHLEMQLGPGKEPPVGSLDPAQFIADVLEMSDGAGLDETNQDLFLTVGAYYRWLGETGALEKGRATEIANTLSALGVGPRSYE